MALRVGVAHNPISRQKNMVVARDFKQCEDEDYFFDVEGASFKVCIGLECCHSFDF